MARVAKLVFDIGPGARASQGNGGLHSPACRYAEVKGPDLSEDRPGPDRCQDPRRFNGSVAHNSSHVCLVRSIELSICRSTACEGISNVSVLGKACWLHGSSPPSQTTALEYPRNAHEASLLLSKFMQGA